ncbi:transposase [Vibrio cholerae]
MTVKQLALVLYTANFAVDTYTHEIIADELTLSGIADAEVLPSLLKQTLQTVKVISGDGSFDARDCYRAISLKKATPLIPPENGASFSVKGHTRNHAVVIKNSMALTKSGNKSMVTKSAHCLNRHVSYKAAA